MKTPEITVSPQEFGNQLIVPLIQQVTFIPRSRLGKFVDQSQLPLQLGGCFIYSHEQWFENRLVRLPRLTLDETVWSYLFFHE